MINMINYKQACEQVGYDRSVTCPIVSITVWYAYKEGVAKEFTNKIDARSYSPNYEPVTSNKAEVEAWWNARKELEAKACAVWYLALTKEYINDHFNEELFKLCYNVAYDRGHSAGYDEVASHMDSIVDFAIKVRSIS